MASNDYPLRVTVNPDEIYFIRLNIIKIKTLEYQRPIEIGIILTVTNVYNE